MTILAAVLLLVGFVLSIGPRILDGFLYLMASFNPESKEAYYLLIALVFINVILSSIYRRLRKRKKFGKFLEIVHTISIIVVLILLLNPQFLWAENNWLILRDESPSTFATLRIVGIITIGTAIGFFIGKHYKDKPKKPDHFTTSEAGVEELDGWYDENNYKPKSKPKAKDNSDYTAKVVELPKEMVYTSDLDVKLPEDAKSKLN